MKFYYLFWKFFSFRLFKQTVLSGKFWLNKLLIHKNHLFHCFTNWKSLFVLLQLNNVPTRKWGVCLWTSAVICKACFRKQGFEKISDFNQKPPRKFESFIRFVSNTSVYKQFLISCYCKQLHRQRHSCIVCNPNLLSLCMQKWPSIGSTFVAVDEFALSYWIVAYLIIWAKPFLKEQILIFLRFV